MKTTFLVTVLVLVLGLAGSSPADLVGHWRLDEASDTTAYDSSGNGNDGTLVGDPQWVPGYIGGALEFDGVDDHVSLFSPIDALIGDTVTISAWIKADSVAAGYHPIVTQYDTNWNGYYFYLHNDRPAFYLNYENQARSDEPINTGEWYHIAGTYDSSDLKIYVNGILKHTNSLDSNSGVDHNAYIGRDDVHYSYFDGMIEDVRVYDRALSTAEIKELAACPKAHNPSPPDGALLTSFPGGILGYSLSWTPGDFVVSHDVYFGDNFDDVNDGTGGTFQGNQGALYFLVGYGYTPNDPCPTGFVSGTTYYWRIDEVNEVDDESPWKGRVWSFSVPDTKA